MCPSRPNKKEKMEIPPGSVTSQPTKSVDGSFSAIPGGALHPQALPPGFQMYTCWMIRCLDGNPWLRTDRCEGEHYTWLQDVSFD